VFPSLPGRDALRPPLPPIYEEARAAFFAAVFDTLRTLGSPAFYRVAAIGEHFYAGRFAETLARLRDG
jgi:hypothetical protein